MDKMTDEQCRRAWQILTEPDPDEGLSEAEMQELEVVSLQPDLEDRLVAACLAAWSRG